MGELSKSDAEKRRNNYVTEITKVRNYILEDFEEMDFQNADQRDAMEKHIENLEAEYNSLITTLNNMTFE